jgi:DNA-binding transcriptional ArsR family regulator
MVNYLRKSLDATFSALADPTRRAILARLAAGESSVTQLAEPFDVSLPAISKHLQVLENAGLLVREREGRTQLCRLVAAPMKDAARWIGRYRRFWQQPFDALAEFPDESRKTGAARKAIPKGRVRRNFHLTKKRKAVIFNRKVKYSENSLDATFSALADPTRRAILARLAWSDSPVTGLAEPFEVSLPAISKHLRVLENAGLLAREKEGRRQRCRLVAAPMKEAAEWIAHYRLFWEKQFDALAAYLEKSTKGKEKHLWPPSTPPPKPLYSSNEPSRPHERKSSAPGQSRRR